MENSTENKIYISTLKTAIQKALTKNLPLILNDAVEYLENHDFEVKQRKRRTKTKSLQNIVDLQKKIQSASAKKMKTRPFLNLNTNRVNSDSKQIKTKHPRLEFGNIKQDDKIVWVCGTPGQRENTLATLKESDEKSDPIWEPMSTISESEESDKSDEEEPVESDEEEPVESDEEGPVESDKSDEEGPVEEDEEGPVEEDEEGPEPVEEDKEGPEPVEEDKEEDLGVDQCRSSKNEWNSKTFDDLSDKEENLLVEEINNMLDLPENEVDPQTGTLVSSKIILQGEPPKKPKKFKRRKKKSTGSLKPPKPKRTTKEISMYTTFDQKGTIF